MSTSLLYHAWGTRGYSHLRTSFEQGCVIFTIEQNPETFYCSACGGLHVFGAVWSGVVCAPCP